MIDQYSSESPDPKKIFSPSVPFPSLIEAVLLIAIAITAQDLIANLSMPLCRVVAPALPSFIGNSAHILSAIVAGIIVLFALFCYLFLYRHYPARSLGLTTEGVPVHAARGFYWSIVAIAAGIVLSIVVFTIAIFAMVATGWNVEEAVKFIAKSAEREKYVAGILRSPMGAFLGVVIAPVFEEFLFRGVLFGALRRHVPALWAAVLSSAVFTALHFYVLGAPAVFALGVISALVYERHRSLAPSIFMHAFWNLRAFIFIFYKLPV